MTAVPKLPPRKGPVPLGIFFITILILAIFFWGMAQPDDGVTHAAPPFNTLNTGWTQQLDGASVTLPAVQQWMQPQQEAPLVFERVIGSALAGGSIAFYTEHQEVLVAVDGQVLYQLDTPDYMASFGSPGRTWVSVYIPDELEGQTLQLTLRSNFDMFQGVPAEIYSAPGENTFLAQVRFLWVEVAATLVLFGLAGITFLNMFLWDRRNMREFLCALGSVYLFVGLWLSAEINILGGWLNHSAFVSMLAMVFLRVVPITLYYFFIAMSRYTSWRTRLARKLVWGNLLLALCLQFVFGKSLLETLSINIAVVVSTAILGLWEIGSRLGEKTESRNQTGIYRASGLLLVASVAECYIYVNYQTYGRWMGVVLALSCIVHAMVSHIHMVRQESSTAVEKERLEQTQRDLIRRPLNQQINAHFLYNSLNAISAFCKIDPPRADLAVVKMAQYMRAYTNLVGANNYVSLEEELDLMQLYIELQNMRFDNGIQFSIQHTCDDILLPPLALQPLVENAVNHGMQNRQHQGTISIQTRMRHNMAEIVVRDDGVGFDTSQRTNARGVGLENLEQRIQAMGGSLTIQSAPQAGTAVTLRIPCIYDDELDTMP